MKQSHQSPITFRRGRWKRPSLRRWPVVFLIAVAGPMASLPAAAATVYRCGVDGRVFSDLPCRDGEKLSLLGQPALLAPGEARNVAQSEARLALQLERQRHARSAAAVSGPGGIGRPNPNADEEDGAELSKAQRKKSTKKSNKKGASGRSAAQTFDDGVMTPPLRGSPGAAR